MKVCSICNQKSTPEIIHTREMVHGTHEPFEYSLCGSCGTLALVDSPVDLAPYYENYYSLSGVEYDPYNKTSPLSRYFLNHLRRWALRHSIVGRGAVARYIYRRKGGASLDWGPMFSKLRNLGFETTI
jgi:hypothetical protein